MHLQAERLSASSDFHEFERPGVDRRLLRLAGQQHDHVGPAADDDGDEVLSEGNFFENNFLTFGQNPNFCHIYLLIDFSLILKMEKCRSIFVPKKCCSSTRLFTFQVNLFY